MSCAPCDGDTIGDCFSCPDPKRITIAASIGITGFHLFEAWPSAGTADVTHWNNSGTLTPVAGGWSKTAWTAGEFLFVRHYLESPVPTSAPSHPFPAYSDASGSRLWSDRGIRVFKAKVNMSPAPAPPVHMTTGDSNWQEMDPFTSPSGEPNRTWNKPVWNNAVAWPEGSIVTKTGSSAGLYVAQEDIAIGAAAPGTLATWLPWAVKANLDQQSADTRLFRRWEETVEWDLPDGVGDPAGSFAAVAISPSTGTAQRTVDRISWINGQQPDDGPDAGDIPDQKLHFWFYMFLPQRPGSFDNEKMTSKFSGFSIASRWVLDTYSRTDSKIEAGFKEVMRFGLDQSPANTLTQTYELTDEFDPDDEWVLRAEEALAIASFGGLTNLKHHLAFLNGDESVTVNETVSVAGASAIRGDHVLQKLMQTVIGDYCLTFTPSPSGSVVCEDGHVEECTDLEIDPPATDGETMVGNPCTCAP